MSCFVHERANLWFFAANRSTRMSPATGGRTNIPQGEPRFLGSSTFFFFFIYHYESAATYEVVRPAPSRNRSSVREVLRRCSIDDTVRTLDCDASSLTSVRVVFSRIGQPTTHKLVSAPFLFESRVNLQKFDLHFERSFRELRGVLKYTIDRYLVLFRGITFVFFFFLIAKFVE